MTVAFVGIGANLGDPRGQVLAAFDALDALPATHVTGRSSLYRSAPLGYAAQADFVNAAARIDTALESLPLIEGLQAIESRFGRVRTFANAPRMLDLDLLLYGAQRIESRALSVPHPRMHERAFVLMPLLELDPGLVVPGVGAVRDLLAACALQSVGKLDG